MEYVEEKSWIELWTDEAFEMIWKRKSRFDKIEPLNKNLTYETKDFIIIIQIGATDRRLAHYVLMFVTVHRAMWAVAFL